MSFSVEIITSRLWPVSSEVSIRIASETASCGAAKLRGPSGRRAGDIELRSGSRRVSSNPKSALVLDLRLSVETTDMGWAEVVFAEARLASWRGEPALAAAAPAVTVTSLEPAGLGGASSAAPLAINACQPAPFP